MDTWPELRARIIDLEGTDLDDQEFRAYLSRSGILMTDPRPNPMTESADFYAADRKTLEDMLEVWWNTGDFEEDDRLKTLIEERPEVQ